MRYPMYREQFIFYTVLIIALLLAFHMGYTKGYSVKKAVVLSMVVPSHTVDNEEPKEEVVKNES